MLNRVIDVSHIVLLKIIYPHTIWGENWNLRKTVHLEVCKLCFIQLQEVTSIL